MNDETHSMTSSRPYLLRALSEWINENHLTPFIVVDVASEQVIVPRQFVENGKIVLNISPFAVRDLNIDNETLFFSARFSGKPMDVSVPVSSVLAIYAKENGQGMVFTDEPNAAPPESPTPPSGGGKKPALKLIK